MEYSTIRAAGREAVLEAWSGLLSLIESLLLDYVLRGFDTETYSAVSA
jgi:hypothetical protein